MITEVQRQLRTGRVGSSDAAAICGLDPYRSAYDVWATMTGRVAGFVGNEATKAGTFMERGILDWVEAELQRPVNRDVFVEHDDGIRVANLDGLVLANAVETIEGKTCGILYPAKMKDEYGDPDEGIDGVPQHVVVQTHHQVGVIEPVYGRAERIHVAALIGFRGFVRYTFEPDWSLAEAIGERVCRFVEQHVRTDTPPDGGPSEDVAKRLPRIAGKIVPIDPTIVAEWRRQDAIAKEHSKTADELKSQVIAMLGDAESGTSNAGCITYKAQARAAYHVAEATFRVLRFKASK